MKTASITEAKNNLSALIDGLKSGSPVLIVDRGRPVARLEPATAGHEVGKTEGCRGSSATALCGPAAQSHRGRSSAASRRARAAAHRRSMSSSKSAGKDREILGCLRGHAAAGRRTDDAALASARGSRTPAGPGRIGGSGTMDQDLL